MLFLRVVLSALKFGRLNMSEIYLLFTEFDLMKSFTLMKGTVDHFINQFSFTAASLSLLSLLL